MVREKKARCAGGGGGERGILREEEMKRTSSFLGIVEGQCFADGMQNSKQLFSKINSFLFLFSSSEFLGFYL